MSFIARFGYVPPPDTHEGTPLSVALKRLAVNYAPPPPAYDPGVSSEPVVQVYDDCVPVTVAKSMRKRIVLQRPRASRDGMAWPEKLSSRWGYWQWLESQGKLGVETTGTNPYAYVDLLNERGWCGEQWMPYVVDGATPPISEAAGPPLEAMQHARDQRGRLKTHTLSDTIETRIAMANDLAVCLAFACDQRIVSADGIPNDPDYVWDFDTGSSIVGWHMIEAESYDSRGIWCQNTWGAFGAGGYVRIGWTTLASSRYTMNPLALDWVPQTSEEVAEAEAT
jgi:hypothetical protein